MGRFQVLTAIGTEIYPNKWDFRRDEGTGLTAFDDST